MLVSRFELFWTAKFQMFVSRFVEYFIPDIADIQYGLEPGHSAPLGCYKDGEKKVWSLVTERDWNIERVSVF